jgi:hypothetical protein
MALECGPFEAPYLSLDEVTKLTDREMFFWVSHEIGIQGSTQCCPAEIDIRNLLHGTIPIYT